MFFDSVPAPHGLAGCNSAVLFPYFCGHCRLCGPHRGYETDNGARIRVGAMTVSLTSSPVINHTVCSSSLCSKRSVIFRGNKWVRTMPSPDHRCFVTSQARVPSCTKEPLWCGSARHRLPLSYVRKTYLFLLCFERHFHWEERSMLIDFFFLSAPWGCFPTDFCALFLMTNCPHYSGRPALCS